MTPALTEGARVRVVGTDDAAGEEGVVVSVHVRNGVVVSALVTFGLVSRRLPAAKLELLPPEDEQ
jgi:hypothetical protein